MVNSDITSMVEEMPHNCVITLNLRMSMYKNISTGAVNRQTLCFLEEYNWFEKISVFDR